MPVKVKRGLGLLVVALVGFLLVATVHENDGYSTPAQVVEAVGYLCLVIGLWGGLILIAWGLLRD